MCIGNGVTVPIDCCRWLKLCKTEIENSHLPPVTDQMVWTGLSQESIQHLSRYAVLLPPCMWFDHDQHTGFLESRSSWPLCARVSRMLLWCVWDEPPSRMWPAHPPRECAHPYSICWRSTSLHNAILQLCRHVTNRCNHCHGFTFQKPCPTDCRLVQ